jgi:hypothetical protein
MEGQTMIATWGREAAYQGGEWQHWRVAQEEKGLEQVVQPRS